MSTFLEMLTAAKDYSADSVAGIGGGSVLDVAKLVAALVDSEQTITEIIGIGILKKRRVFLVCIPTTSGTGSEVSPNAILLDEADNQKKGIISPYLVPDAAYIDPLLTVTVPPHITAFTAIDALTHCIEAYANRFAHPIIDHYALKGIELIAANIEVACKNGANVPAREALSLGSLYGGLCLGPVNTAAVHALAYPLGSKYRIAHGLANAVLLPHVLKFNLGSVTNKYSDIALALGAEQGSSFEVTAENGVKRLLQIYERINLSPKLSEMDIPLQAIDFIAKEAMQVTRLLQNNPRVVTFKDAQRIYLEAF